MIKATFDRSARTAAGTGATQYDAGQKIALYGIPQTLEGTAEVQFAYAGDAKAETRNATYDKTLGAWVASVPNKYLTRSRAVNAYLYVRADSETGRTVYTAVFTPTARAAPSDEVTEDETNAWGELVGQITEKLAEMDTAIGRANTAASSVGSVLEEAEGWESRLAQAESDASTAKNTATAAQNTANAAIPKVGGATQGDIPTFNASGALADSGVKMSSFTRAKMTLSGTTLTITTVN